MAHDLTHANLGEVGRPARRLEDRRFLVGRGRYVDDIVLPRQLYAAFVRSPHAHARIAALETEDAARAPGVAAVWTAAHLADVPDLTPNWIFPGTKVHGRPPLAREVVRHVGEAVAVVVAETLAAAVDAAELVRVRYDVLRPLIDQTDAAAEGAPRVHDDVPGNVATVFATGTQDFERAAEGADLRVTLRLRNQRLIPFPLEPRAVNADYNAGSGKLTFYSSNQIPHMLRRMLAGAIGFPEQKLRVISPDVGGGFGPKMHLYPEEIVLARLTQALGRPVKWTERRSENVVATTHGRDHVMTADIAAQRDGRILALRVNSLANVGAYLSSMGSGVPTVNVGLFLLGVYAIPSSEVLIRCVYTHTPPVDAYRGAGRPEAAYLIERVLDRVAQELKLDPAEVRRRNFVTPAQLPYPQPTGTTLDTGDYAGTLQTALDRLGYAALREAQRTARAEGRLMGMGISNYTETCGVGNAAGMAFAGFDRGGFESAVVRVQPDGRVTILSGSHSHGQGHATTFAQIAADELGAPIEDIEVIQGDTDAVPFGIGTFNSRSVPVGGSAVKLAAARVGEKMRRIAAHLMQCDVADVIADRALFRARGGNASIGFKEIGRAAWTGQGLPPGLGIGLEETEFYHPQAMSSPYGSHIAVVDVDRETGEVRVRQYLAVDDCGVVINPLLARGQVHGGVAQGVGQALWEAADLDAAGHPDPDPPIPRFDTMPSMETGHTVSPTPTNPLGAKGLGEAGTIGAPPAIVNAVIDALWPLGVKEIDMPLTPERVLRAIAQAEAAAR